MRASRIFLGVVALALVVPLAGCGTTGAAGPEGPAGPAGVQGADGKPGATGAPGAPGSTGATGATGARGADGADGAQGPAGAAGPAGGPQGPAGPMGPQGLPGIPGPVGARGVAGAPGAAGAPGQAGAVGPIGPQGGQGIPGAPGAQGIPGVQGAPGVAGPVGPAGSGDSALFYALMPADNPFILFAAAPVEFPQNGPSTSSDILRAGLNSTTDFILATAGVYRVTFQVPVDQPGQLVVRINTVQVPYTVTGRATGSSVIGATTLITAAAGDVLSITNTDNAVGGLGLTPFAGGNEPVSATLLIELVE
jgi:hypothetical protein